jgi:hypothetical protein
MKVTTVGVVGSLDRIASRRYGVPGEIFTEGADRAVCIATLREIGIRDLRLVVRFGASGP